MATDLDPLEDLLAESMAQQAQARKVRDARKSLTTARTVGERDALREYINHYDEIRVWSTESNVALVREYRCACGSIDQHFEGWMREQRHRIFANTRRLVSGKCPGVLPVRLERHVLHVSECVVCIEQQILLLNAPTVIVDVASGIRREEGAPE